MRTSGAIVCSGVIDGTSIVSANVFFALSNSSTNTPADTAFTYDNFPPLNAGNYVWQATKITDSDGKTSLTGKICLGPTTDFLSGTEVYAISTSNSTAPEENTTNWKTTYEKTKGYYLWTATRVQYTNGNYAYLNKKCVGYWGEDGNGIQSVARTYARSKNSTSTNDTTAPSNIDTSIGTNGWAASSPSVTETYPYLWVKEVVTYTKSAATTKYYCIGARGANGVDAQDIEWVYIRTKTNVAPVISGDGGSSPYTDHNSKTYTSDDHLPKVVEGSGGSLSDIEDGNSGSSSKKYECTDDPKGVDSTWKFEWEIKREKGDADANGHRAWQAYSGTMTLHNRYVKDITSANVWYALADSGTTKPNDDAFTLDAFPTTLNAGKYVWEATKVTYSDDTSEFTAKMCLGPTTDFLSGTEVYAISTSNSTAPAENTTNWKTTYEKTKGNYLWTATRVQYTNGNYAYLNKKCVGYWGEDGNNAPYDVVTYGRSKSRSSYSSENLDTSYGTNGWGSTAPSATTTYPYIWEKIEHYNSSGTYQSTSYVCLTGSQGPQGTGIQGKMGRFIWYAGLMSEVGGTSFDADDYQAPYVNIGTDDDPYCYAYVGSNGTTTFPNVASGYTLSNGWEKMTTEFKYLITKAIFTSFAHFGGFIINEDYLLSQYGTLVSKSSTGERVETRIYVANVKVKYNGITPIVLYGDEVDDIIVCKVSFYATANSQIKITLTPSSEPNCDFGAIGVLGTESFPGNAKWLESATQTTVKNTSVGTYMLKKASGTTPVDTTITIPSTGEYFIEIAYATDIDAANDDKVTFVFEKKSGTVTWRNLNKVKSGPYMKYTGYCQNAVPYAWFDPADPVAEIVPETGYKFRPTKCVNALTGEEWMAGGNVHVSQTGDITMQNAVIEGSLMYHKTIVDNADNSIRPFTMWSLTGVAVDIDGSATVENVTMQLDTIIIAGKTRTSTYNLFNGIIATGYTVLLPPAKFFPGMRVRIVNGTFSGGNGNAASLSPSAINLAVIYRTDTEELVDYIDNSYDANMIASALPVTFNASDGNDFTFVGAPDSNKHIDYTPTTAEHFTVYGLRGSTNKNYKSIELAALENPYVSGTHYCWMIIDAQE